MGDRTGSCLYFDQANGLNAAPDANTRLGQEEPKLEYKCDLSSSSSLKPEDLELAPLAHPA